MVNVTLLTATPPTVRVVVGPLATTGETAAASVTVPVKPTTAVTLMIDVPDVPAVRVRVVGEADMINVAALMNVAV